MIEFRYKPIIFNPRKRIFIFRPIIPIFLVYRNRKIGYEALIDSGADRCYFHAEVGEYLGLEIKKGAKEEFFGVKGEVGISYFHEIKLEIKNKIYKINCGFSYDISDDGFGILGQDGFFNIFDVKFSFKNKKITLIAQFSQNKKANWFLSLVR